MSRLSPSVLLLLAALGPLSAGADSTLYRHATLIDATQPTAQTDMALRIVDDRIEQVVPDADVDRLALTADHSVDLSGRYVMPGLVDTHVHVATYPNVMLAKAQLELYVMSGITTVRDMAGDNRLLAELRRELLLGEIPGPELYYSALMAGDSFFVDPRTQAAAQAETAGQVPWMQAINAKTDAALAVAQAKGSYASGIKLYANMPASDIRRISAEADKQHMMIWSHGTVFPARPSELLDAGVQRLSHIYMLGYETADDMRGTSYQKRPPVDFATLTPEHHKLQALLKKLQAKHGMLDATLYVINYAANNEQIPAEHRVGLPAQFQFSLKMARAAEQAGILLTTGSDVYVGLEFGAPGLWPELETWQQDAGFTPQQIIKAATLNGAILLGKETDIGTLTAGKLANFIVLRDNPLTDIRAIKSIETTVLHGKALQRSDYHLTDEIWKALRE
ncbi:amidohydrolase family protein [Permianibacter sp. IMCC34836]|uniref:amidohydrolase family protein n=1 Tax=Permianibacter fluminis TaxID=2738515 RepID=UPI0015543BF8|nr:amidohydrolase family protein [Permianibacter fluminis]NQD37155.1 amidohydrolase family protein [Permianibacter fluminis]